MHHLLFMRVCMHRERCAHQIHLYQCVDVLYLPVNIYQVWLSSTHELSLTCPNIAD